MVYRRRGRPPCKLVSLRVRPADIAQEADMIVSSAHRPALGGYREHPLILAVLIVAVVLATAAPIALGVTVDAAYAIGSKIILCGLAVVLLTGLRWWRRAGFLALPDRRDLAWLAPPALLVLAALVAVVVAGPVPMEPALVLAFAIAALGRASRRRRSSGACSWSRCGPGALCGRSWARPLRSRPSTSPG